MSLSRQNNGNGTVTYNGAWTGPLAKIDKTMDDAAHSLWNEDTDGLWTSATLVQKLAKYNAQIKMDALNRAHNYNTTTDRSAAEAAAAVENANDYDMGNT